MKNNKPYTMADELRAVGAWEYKRVDTSTLDGIKQAEQLQAQGWSIYSAGLYLVDFQRKKPLPFVYDDGGRAKYFTGSAGDCVTRAIAIATEQDYLDIYKALSECGNSARNGVKKDKYAKLLAKMGWQWHACMTIGSGCKVHLRANELPKGRIIARLSGHICAVIDGIVYDTYDCTRDGTRCVYGYWKKGAE